VRDDPDDQSTGEFTLNPGDGTHPSSYVEVLQEVVPRQGGPAEIRFQYANTRRAQANFFSNRSDHYLKFRLEGALRCFDLFALRFTSATTRMRDDGALSPRGLVEFVRRAQQQLKGYGGSTPRADR
jgi:hypothetical protein